jgi:hypothetical protein
MDDTDITSEQLIPKFREFELTKRVQFGRLVISFDPQQTLKVSVYCRWRYQENATQAEAEGDLKAAKEFISDICSKNEGFKKAFEKHTVQYEYLFDYGTAAVLLYRLAGNKAEKA